MKKNLSRAALETLKQQQKGGRVRDCDILLMMKEKFNMDRTLNTVYHTLARLEFAGITGRPCHPSMNVQAQEKFKKICRKSEKAVAT